MNATVIPQLSTLALVLYLLVSVLLPLASSLLVKNEWVAKHPEISGILTLLLSAVTGLVTEALKAGSGFDWKRAVQAAVVSFALAVASRVALWRGSTADRKALNVGSKTKA